MKKPILFRACGLTISDKFRLLNISSAPFVDRHSRGDWGELEPPLQNLQDRWVLDSRFEGNRLASIFFHDGNAIIVLSKVKSGELTSHIGVCTWNVGHDCRFDPGLVFTSSAVRERGIDVTQLIFRHTSGDWGGMPRNRQIANEAAVRISPEWIPSKVASGYSVENSMVFVCTEPTDHGPQTTVELAEERLEKVWRPILGDDETNALLADYADFKRRNGYV